MEDVFMVAVLIFSSAIVYHVSYRVLWFKAGSLFDLGEISSASRHASEISHWELDDNAFLRKLYSEYSVSSYNIRRFIRVLFSIAMVSYTAAIEIILWQIGTADGEQKADFVTKIVWPIVSIILTTLLILAQPFLIIISLLNKFYNDKYEIERLIILTCLIVGALITSLNLTRFGPFKFTTDMLTKVSIVGVTIMAFLSGVASVSTFYYTLTFVFKRYKHRNNNNDSQGYDFETSRSLLWTADEMIYNQIEKYNQKITKKMLVLKNLEEETNGKSSEIRRQLIDRITWFQLEIVKLENRVNQSRQSIFTKKALHFVFLLYCLHKLIFTFTKSVPHIIKSWLGNKIVSNQLTSNDLSNGLDTTEWIADPLAITIARILDFFLFRFNYQYELDSLTKQISFLLSISLFICSLSAVATTISYIIEMLPTKFKVLALYSLHNNDSKSELPKYRGEASRLSRSPSMIKNLIVSELSGIYVVATVLSLRSNLPFEVSEKVNELLGQGHAVPNIIIDCWFELNYAISSILTILFIKIAEHMLPTSDMPVTYE